MNIRTKIIGGYLLFVLAILFYLGLNYLLAAKSMRGSERLYDVSEDIRMEMEAKNIFCRQVIALTDYFVTGEEEHKTEFHTYQNAFVERMAVVEATSDGEAEREALRQMRGRYDLFIAKFDQTAAIYKAGR